MEIHISCLVARLLGSGWVGGRVEVKSWRRDHARRASHVLPLSYRLLLCVAWVAGGRVMCWSRCDYVEVCRSHPLKYFVSATAALLLWMLLLLNKKE